MISYLSGKLMSKNETSCTILTNNGVGFLVNININLIKDLRLNDNIELFIKTIIRENDISLYGFANNEQVSLFEHLLSVNGVGPKAAMNIISNIGTADLISDIVSEQSYNIAKIKGLGKKTAEKIVFTLKDKFKKEYTSVNKSILNDDIDLVLQSLLALGYANKEALPAVNKTYSKEVSIQENIKNALRSIKENDIRIL